jgi:transposase-like protein
MAGKTHRVGPSIIQTAKDFASESVCHNYLEAARWPDGVRCLQCGGAAISKFTVKGKTRVVVDKATGQETIKTGPDRYMYQCLERTCKYQFAATTGTIFSDTKLPLRIWMQAIALMCTAKKGISAKQMERTMDVSYKTAWYLNHRIREAMAEGMEGMFTGTVELDATFVGGKYDKRRKRAKYDKQAVFGLVQRGTEEQHSKVYTQVVPIETRPATEPIINARVSKDALLCSDEGAAYRRLKKDGWRHEIVIHTKGEYVRGSIHNNSVEGFWSLFKRGVIGSFHQVSVKHLDRYLSEFTFRFNHRQDEEIFAAVVLGLVAGIALRYKVLTAGATASASPVSPDLPESDEPF